eukprot:scaffold40371_cov206-Amphora_coffeaeformis.AAC.2
MVLAKGHNNMSYIEMTKRDGTWLSRGLIRSAWPPVVKLELITFGQRGDGALATDAMVPPELTGISAGTGAATAVPAAEARK